MKNRPSVYAMLLFFLLVITSVQAEEAEEFGSTKIDLANGSFYYKNVPDTYKPDGTWGVVLILHGSGGTAKGMLDTFLFFGKDYLKENKLIGVAPKSKESSWGDTESTPMDSLKEIMSRYKIDKKRIHILGFSAGGFMTGWITFEQPELFCTATIIGASLVGANMGNVKKNAQKPIFFIAGERDFNLEICKADYNRMVSFGSHTARFHEEPGAEHSFSFPVVYPKLFKWMKAMESGYDYFSALERAEKKIKKSITAAIKIVAEIEEHPEEDVFWARLAVIKCAINDKGEKKLEGMLKRLKGKSYEAQIKELKEFESTYAGYSVAKKAAAEREKAEKLLQESQEEKKD